MRILHVVSSGQRRGAEVFSADLSVVLEEACAAQHVAILRGPRAVEYPCPAEVLADGGPMIPGLRMSLPKLAALRRVISTFRPDVIQAHGGDSLKYSVLATAGGLKSRRTPIVFRRIGHAPAWITGGPQRRVHSFLMRRAAVVAAVSESVRRETIDLFGLAENRVLMIPSSSDARRIRPTASPESLRQDLGIEPWQPVVVSVGSLSWEKDPATQLDVAARLRHHPSHPLFLMAGDGPLRAELEEQVRVQGLEGSVRLLGSRSDIGNVLAVSDVLLFTSRPDGMEGMPAVLIEAGLAGLPVVGYAVAGADEVVEHGVTGYLTQPGAPDGLVASLSALLDDPASRAEMGVAAEHACLEYEIQSVAPRYIDLYARLVAGSRAQAGTGGAPRQAATMRTIAGPESASVSASDADVADAGLAPRSTARVLDVVGLALLVAAIGWTFVASSVSGGDPARVAGLLAVCGLAWVTGRAVAAGDRQLIPASIVLVAAWLLVTRTKGTLSTAPLAGPLGYANAKASLFLQAAVAALMLVAAARGWVGRILGLVAALAFVAVPLVIHSYMAAGVALTLPALALVVNGRNRGRLTAWVLSVVLCLALLGTVLAGLSFRRMESSGNALNRVYAFLSERRPALWSDALEEMVEHPAFGVGPGRFPEFSAVSRSDPDDAAWAHNGFLQQGAEQGVIGLALVVLLFVWGLLRLGATPGGDRVTALAAVALAALGVHACMDYIFHFAALPIMAAALAGAGVVAPGRPRT